MEEDDDEDEEEVEPEEGDDPISSLDSDHDEDQIAQYLVEVLNVSSLVMQWTSSLNLVLVIRLSCNIVICMTITRLVKR